MSINVEGPTTSFVVLGNKLLRYAKPHDHLSFPTPANTDIMADHDPAPKRTKVESSGKYDVLASDYFKDQRFFINEKKKNTFVEGLDDFEPQEDEPNALDLRTLKVHEFYEKASELYKNDDDKLTIFFVDNISACMRKVVLADYHQWRKVAGMQSPDPPRMVSVGFKIQDTELSHTVDLDCFAEKVEKLFKWWDEKDDDPNKLVGPYLCFVQSSGMGKTKLMYEYRKLNKPPGEIEDNQTQDFDKVVAQLILPTNIDLGKEEEQEEGLFDHQLALDEAIDEIPESENDALKKAAEKVYEKLDAITRMLLGHKKIVLLFDECHRLLKKEFKCEAFLFRCIRVWLREERLNGPRVVAVFAGTNSRLNNFFVQSDGQLKRKAAPSREHERDVGNYDPKGSRPNPPFFQMTTIGSCLALLHDDEDAGLTEYARSVYYGRPLFALMARTGEDILNRNLPMVLSRMLLSSKNWEDNRNAWINLLSTRVQMGQTTMAVTSDLVAKAYANLTGYFEETNSAQLAYLPDPVCGRLSMCMMDENFTCRLPDTNTLVTGQKKKWWTEQLQKIFSSGIVSPEKGDFGEVMVALYMLFCADLLREKSNERGNDIDNKDKEKYMIQQAYTQFSVSLHDFLLALKAGRDELSETGKACKVSVGFVQVCRNSLRSYCDSWEALADTDFLKFVYESGTAFYVCPGCPVIDLVIPLRIETSAEPDFIPMLVSIKCHTSFSTKSAVDVCNKMKERAETDKLTKAFCLLVVFGWESMPKSRKSETFCKNDFDDLIDITGVSDSLSSGVVTKAIFVPQDDDFGLSNAFKSITPNAQVFGELLVSHPYIKAHGHTTFDGLNKPLKAMRSTSTLFQNLYKKLRNALIGTSNDMQT